MPSSSTRQPRLNLDFRGRGYVFTVVTLAAFALALVAFRPRTQLHVVESLVEYYPGKRVNSKGYAIELSEREAQSIAAELQQHIRSPDILQPALAEAEGRLSQNPDSATNLEQKLFVRMELHGDDPSTLRIRYLSKHTDFARALLDAITDRFIQPRLLVDNDPESATNQKNDKFTFAEATVKEWSQRCQELELAVDELVGQQLSKMRQSHAVHHEPPTPDNESELTPPSESLVADTDPASEAPESPQPPATSDPSQYPSTGAPLIVLDAGTAALDLEAVAPEPDQDELPVESTVSTESDTDTTREVDTVVESFAAQPEPNPRWLELHDELAVAQRRAHQMLKTYTPEHPYVTELLTEVEAIRQALHATPRTLTPVESPVRRVAPKPQFVPPSEESVARVAVPQPVVPFDEDKARQMILSSEAYQRLQSQLENAIAKREEAVAHLQSLPVPDPLAVSKLDAEVECARLLQPSRRVEMGRMPITTSRLLSMLIPACLLGGVFAASRRRTPAPEFICSREDAERSLELPVIGGVAKPKAPPFELPANPTPRFVFMGVRVAEAVMVAVIVLTCVGFVTLPEFAKNFAKNPLDAYGAGLNHIETYFTSRG